MFVFAALSLLTAASAASPAIDPLLPAQSGEMQCYEPDEARKTCRSLASYDKRDASSYDNRAIVLISPSEPVVLETVTPVTIQAGAVCGAIRPEDIQNGKLTISGRVLSADQAAPVLSRIADAMKPIMGKRICTTYVHEKDALIAHATINGVAQPDMDQTVKWVKPSDGYSVAP